MTDTAPKKKGMAFYEAADAPLLDDDGMMKQPYVDPAVYTTLDLSPIADGARVTVLFKGDGPDGLSLVYAKFGPGYRLPRHSHSSDCLYYVLSGEAVMGSRHITAGNGFFLEAEQPYAYQAGPDGVEVLEFRSKTSFDMKIYDQTVERWKPILDAALANHDRWVGAGV